MEENRARRVVEALRSRGVHAALKKAGVYQFGIAVALPDGREAVWDTDGTAALEATVMADGMLRGFVPTIEGSEHFTEEQVVEAIWRTDYDAPIGRRRETAPPTAAPLPPLPGRLPLLTGRTTLSGQDCQDALRLTGSLSARRTAICRATVSSARVLCSSARSSASSRCWALRALSRSIT
jgi:hypothetical protein